MVRLFHHEPGNISGKWRFFCFFRAVYNVFTIIIIIACLIIIKKNKLYASIHTGNAADIALTEWNFNLEVIIYSNHFFLHWYSVAGERTSIIFKMYTVQV